MTNQVQKAEQNTLTVKQLLRQDSYKRRLKNLLDNRAEAFSTSIVNISNLATLKDADPNSIISSAIVAATLDLPIEQNLGFAYIVPYNESKYVDKQWVKTKKAQFQMGYKGFIQLALRSGQYKTINAIPVYKGEIERQNRLTGEVIFKEDTSDVEYTEENIIGYASYFRLTNGFEKILYMTKKQVEDHAKKYSQSYAYDLKEKKKSSRWSQDFESMALKTVIKLLISKFGPLSVKMQDALTNDQAVMNDNKPEYVDNQVSSEISQNANSEVIDIPFEEAEQEQPVNEPVKDNTTTSDPVDGEQIVIPF